MNYLYRIHKIFRIKKELGEVYTNQAIEALALSVICIFIPAYLLEAGFSFMDVVLFFVVNYSASILTRPAAVRINARIGVKHTILIRAPVFILFLAIIMNITALPDLYYAAAVLGGISLALYWTSLTTEYVRVSDRNRPGEEAGLLFGIPSISSVAGPVAGAFILTVLGFGALFMLSVSLVFVSIVPLFLSSDYRSRPFETRRLRLFLDMKKSAYYFAEGTILITDFVFWGLYVFLNYGFIPLGIAASLMGLGMLLFTVVVGRVSNFPGGRRNVARLAGVSCAILWILRFVASSELEVMLLSLLGGFAINSFVVSVFADFTQFAKENGPARSVFFRHFWIDAGRVLPMVIIAILLPGISTIGFIKAMFIISAAASLVLVRFR